MSNGGWQRAYALIRACHPEPAVAVTAGASVLAVAVGRDAIGVIAVGAAVAATQLSVGWCNDWLDAGRDARVGRRDKPVAAGAVSRRAVGLAAIVAGVAAIPLAVLSGWPAGVVLLVALAAGLLYNWPLKFTAWSVVPYVVAFGGLAAYVPMTRPGTPAPPWWLVAAGAALGAGAHFVNVLPDIDDDARTGVRGLPHRLGRRPSTVIAAVALLTATGLLAFGPGHSSAWLGRLAFALSAVVLLIGFVLARRPGSRAAFRAVLVVALVDVALLVAAGTRI